MRPWLLVTILVAAAVILMVVREVRLLRTIDSLQAGKRQFLAHEEAANARLDQAETRLEALQSQVVLAGNPSSSVAANSEVQNRIASFETQLQEFQRALAAAPRRSKVPAYDPTRPPEPGSETELPVSRAPKRSWGTEQVLGPPDTDRAGDIPTAWASRQPDGGAEWLSLGFDRPVDLAEVRVRETYNPGAITKLTAVVNNQEVVLWEGAAAGGEAPRDFVVPVMGNVQAQSVIVHLDTARVSGWNEIDAVELVGRDGSRQWATSVNASSTYAEPAGQETFRASTLP